MNERNSRFSIKEPPVPQKIPVACRKKGVGKQRSKNPATGWRKSVLLGQYVGKICAGWRGKNGVSYPGGLLGEKYSFPSLGVVASGLGDGIFGGKKGMLLADPQNPRHPSNVLRCKLAVRMRRIKRF